jgi:hypothetical protein
LNLPRRSMAEERHREFSCSPRTKVLQPDCQEFTAQIHGRSLERMDVFLLSACKFYAPIDNNLPHRSMAKHEGLICCQRANFYARYLAYLTNKIILRRHFVQGIFTYLKR